MDISKQIKTWTDIKLKINKEQNFQILIKIISKVDLKKIDKDCILVFGISLNNKVNIVDENNEVEKLFRFYYKVFI